MSTVSNGLKPILRYRRTVGRLSTLALFSVVEALAPLGRKKFMQINHQHIQITHIFMLIYSCASEGKVIVIDLV